MIVCRAEHFPIFVTPIVHPFFCGTDSLSLFLILYSFSASFPDQYIWEGWRANDRIKSIEQYKHRSSNCGGREEKRRLFYSST